MGDDDLDPRFHTWLRNRAPKAAPQGLLARFVAQLDNDSRQQGRGWPLLRAGVLVPSFASLLVVALVAALVVMNLPRASRPIAGASESESASPTTTAEASASPTGAATASPSDTPSATPTIAPTVEPTQTAVPTATPFPSPVPTPVPPVVGPPGTLTVRVTLASMPPGTTTIAVGMMGPDGPVDPEPSMWNQSFDLCGGQSATPCDVPGVFEQRFSGLDPGAWIAVGIGARAPGEPGWTILRGQWRADGYLIAGSYPEARAPTGPPRCSGNQWNRQVATRTIDADTSFVAPADMCLTSLQWSFINRIPTTGTSTLLRDGVPIYVLPMADWAAGTYGTQGAGSGEKMVVLDGPIPIARGQTISLAFADCPTCVSEDVNVIATGALWP